jgi:phage-related minor tail protein
MVLVLAALRARFTWFPFTPWGYLIASSYGGTYWASFFLTWVAQRVILRYGGMPLHAKAVPGFLGIAFGYMAATVASLIMGFATGKTFSFSADRRLYFDI